MTESLTMILIGMVLLYGGAEGLVYGASRLAISLGISSLVVGLTVVSLGTSLPEAVSSLFAQIIGGRGDIALGNVIGSNIANIGLVAGVAALIRPIRVRRDLIIEEGAVMVAVTVLLLIVMGFFSIGRIAGGLFCLLLVVFLFWQYRKTRNGKEGERIKPSRKELIQDVSLVGLGGIGLLAGGYFLVEGAVAIATQFGVSERVIGLSVVALGTSLPELATSTVAAWRGKEELSVGNVIGSNIFNILFIVGGVALCAPITFSASLLKIDGMIVLAFTGALAFMMWREHGISRKEGGLLVSAYCLYMLYLFV